MNTWYNRFAALMLFGLLWLVGYNWNGWEKLDAGHWASWVQAVGSIVALAVAIYLSYKQAKDAKEALKLADVIAERRKYKAYSTIAEAALAFIARVENAFQHEAGFLGMVVMVNQFERKRHALIQAIAAIPVHDVGTYPAVEALMQMNTGMADLDRMMNLANAKMESLGVDGGNWIEHETIFIRLNCDVVRAGSDGFIAALAN